MTFPMTSSPPPFNPHLDPQKESIKDLSLLVY